MQASAKFFVSSSCVKSTRISQSIETLAQAGFRYIELSGGTKWYSDYEKDLLSLKDIWGLEYMVHNYFPPPPTDFVFNLASLDSDIHKRTLDHAQRAMDLSRRLGAKHLGFHAGFYMDIPLDQIGKQIYPKQLYPFKEAQECFYQSFRILQKQAGSDLTLYLENNVISKQNLETWRGQCLMMMCESEDILFSLQQLSCPLLLDVAHLYVSAQSLNKSYEQQIQRLWPHAPYIHVSDNDGQFDQNKCFKPDSYLLTSLKRFSFSNKLVTSETYGDIEQLILSQKLVESTLG